MKNLFIVSLVLLIVLVGVVGAERLEVTSSVHGPADTACHAWSERVCGVKYCPEGQVLTSIQTNFFDGDDRDRGYYPYTGAYVRYAWLPQQMATWGPGYNYEDWEYGLNLAYACVCDDDAGVVIDFTCDWGCRDLDGDGYTAKNYDYVPDSMCGGALLDCNDLDASINPGANEILDNPYDENCDGVIDFTEAKTFFCSDSAQTILKLNNYENALGAWGLDGNLSFVYGICYDELFGEPYSSLAGQYAYDCTGSNKVVGLSGVSNAHAEKPEESGVGYIDICYGDLSCTSRTDPEPCEENEVEVVRLEIDTGSELAMSGLFEELQGDGWTIDPEPFILKTYKFMFNKVPSAEELAMRLGEFGAILESRKALVIGFANETFEKENGVRDISNLDVRTPEGAGAYVHTLYEKLLDRVPDSTSWNAWAVPLIDGRMNKADVITGFVNSPEFYTRYSRYLMSGQALCIGDGTCPIKICCRRGASELYFANLNGVNISQADLEDDVMMVLKDASNVTGGTVKFDIFAGASDIRTGDSAITAIVNPEGDAIGYWKITQEDLDSAGTVREFIFNVQNDLTKKSNILTVSDDMNNTPTRLNIVEPECASNFTYGGENVSVRVVVELMDEDTLLQGEVYFGDGDSLPIGNGVTNVSHNYSSPGNKKIVANVSLGLGTVKREISNIMIVSELVSGDYVASCIVTPEDMVNLQSSIVAFDASTTKGIIYDVGDPSPYNILIPGEASASALTFTWTFSDVDLNGDNIQRILTGDDEGAYIFNIQFASSGNNWATLLVDLDVL